MSFDDMFDDGEAKSGAAAFPASRGIGPVEAFCQPRQMLARDSRAMILDGNGDPIRVTAGGNVNYCTGLIAPISNGVADQIVEQLNELRHGRHERPANFPPDPPAIRSQRHHEVIGIGDRGSDDIGQIDSFGGTTKRSA